MILFLSLLFLAVGMMAVAGGSSPIVLLPSFLAVVFGLLDRRDRR